MVISAGQGVLWICLSLLVRPAIQCLQTGNGRGSPQLRDYRDIENDNRIFRHHQAIIPSYKFTCCGNITEWGADVFLNDQNAYTLDFQVWRPSPTVNDSTGTGCYSLVGNNRFTSISLSAGVARVTPSPQDYIQFQPNDVLGVYIESANLVTSRPPNGLVLQITPSRFTSEVVWQASIPPSSAASQNRECPYSVGNGGVLSTLTRAAPVISIATTTFSCGQATSSLTSVLPTSVLTRTPTSPDPTSTSVVDSSSMQSLPEPTNTVLPVDPDTLPSTTQIPWLLIGGVVAGVVLIIIVIIATIIVVCCLREKSDKGASSSHERFYNYPYGATAQTDEDSTDAETVNHHHSKSLAMKTNEAYYKMKAKKSTKPFEEDEHIYNRLSHNY